MKKRYCLLLALLIILATSLTACAFNWKFWQKGSTAKTGEVITSSADFEILPTMDSVSNAKNQVWVGTFQLIWNDLVNELIKQPVEFIGYKSKMAENSIPVRL